MQDEDAGKGGTCAGWKGLVDPATVSNKHGGTTMSGLQDKVALVTGASSGIGRAAAVELSRRGVHVALLARTEAALEETAAQVRRHDRQALVLPADVTD